jgi:hypothetical protein
MVYVVTHFLWAVGCAESVKSPGGKQTSSSVYVFISVLYSSYIIHAPCVNRVVFGCAGRLPAYVIKALTEKNQLNLKRCGPQSYKLAFNKSQGSFVDEIKFTTSFHADKIQPNSSMAYLKD